VLLAVGTALVFGPSAAASAQYANPVIPGNVADPSVVQDGGVYWAAATSGGFAPVFPVFRSTDLVNWTQAGAVFERPPSWARGNFWAPGLTVRGGVWSVYYSASRARGRPCIAVAQASRPTGPWSDRGFVVCPPSGAIDAAPVTDVDGNRYLLWKRMGVGHGIYGAVLSDDGRAVVTDPTELVKPGQPWEQGVTEGPDLVADPAGGYLLVFSGGHCCRPPCSYAVGVARADEVLGPYTKDPANPVLRDGNGWKCAGHGTLVRDPSGGLAFLHHAYRADDPFDVHRQALLDPVRFDEAGAPVFGDGGVPVAAAAAGGAPTLRDEFAGRALAPGWQWAWDQRPQQSVAGGVLRVRRGLVSRAWVPRDYVAEARVRGSAQLGVLLTDGTLIAVRTGGGGLERLDGGRVTARAAGAARELRLDVRGGRALAAYARAGGGSWRRVGAAVVVPEGTAIDRVALGAGTFEAVTLRPYRSAR
jgi:xylan 1,4-beta-xylosidase